MRSQVGQQTVTLLFNALMIEPSGGEKYLLISETISVTSWPLSPGTRFITIDTRALIAGFDWAAAVQRALDCMGDHRKEKNTQMDSWGVVGP
ncbi:unnamed protein product [Phytophthora lilii]|uniref:Unnamed protein product n=1 Tax=Phytophthora lilii TaxID=2077276 RepID=A0A9W6TFM1_9STRA|nr:unnamed protein product [Phytophthora lilii]